MSANSGALRCQSCGAVAMGKYCSQCGARLQAASSSGWVDALGTLAGDASKAGVIGALLVILKSPIAGTIALADDRSYNGHLKFFTACTAVNVAFFVIVVPALISSYFHVSIPAGHARQVAVTIWYYVTIVPILFVAYYLFRLGSGRKRSPHEFVKLALIGHGFTGLVIVGVTALFLPLVVIFGVTMAFASFVTGITYIPVGVYAFLVYREFWQTSGVWTACVVALIFFSSYECMKATAHFY